MVRRCVFGCSNARTLFCFPTTNWLRRKWLEFIHFEEGAICSSSRLCDRHFSDECFTNLGMVTAGITCYLTLADTAVPSLYTVGASPHARVSIVFRSLRHYIKNKIQSSSPPFLPALLSDVTVFWTGSFEPILWNEVEKNLFASDFQALSEWAEPATDMVKRCVLGCYPHNTLFPFPKLQWLRARWLEFLHFEEGGISDSSRLCASHFAPACFTNLQQYQMGFADFLNLIDTAIPTIYTVGSTPSVKVSSYAWLTTSPFIQAKNRPFRPEVVVWLTYKTTNHARYVFKATVHPKWNFCHCLHTRLHDFTNLYDLLSSAEHERWCF